MRQDGVLLQWLPGSSGFVVPESGDVGVVCGSVGP